MEITQNNFENDKKHIRNTEKFTDTIIMMEKKKAPYDFKIYLKKNQNQSPLSNKQILD